MTEREKWHKQENNTMILKDSSDWKLAEKYAKYHSIYNKHLGVIKEAWRDKHGQLCIQYVSAAGELTNWFHYVVNDNDITWW